MNIYKSHLMSWITGLDYRTGSRGKGSMTVLVADGADVGPLVETGWVGVDSVVYAPAATGTSTAPLPDPTRLVPYSGSPVTSCGELMIGEDFYLQVQPYAVAGFLTVLGPTAVRITEDADAQAFLEDADTAYLTGRFPDLLINPLVQLADPWALATSAAPGDGPGRRLFVDHDHAIRVSLSGDVLATVGTGWDAQGDGAPARLPVSDALRAEFRRRPWLGRYLLVIRALQSLSARGISDLTVSGFGGRPDTSDPGADAVLAAQAPVLARSGSHCFIVLPDSGRTFTTDLDTLAAVERGLQGMPPVDGERPGHAGTSGHPEVSYRLMRADRNLTCSR